MLSTCMTLRCAGTQDRMQAYVDLVCAEVKATRPLGHAPLTTVSFGGGTPSLVPPHLLESILSALQQQFGIAADAEVSLEADPGTFDLQRLLQYKALGVTRVSMGVQSFQEDLLKACGRSHSLSDVYAAIDAATAARLPSWSLDLISGLPGLKLPGWQHSLDQAVAAAPDHISVYDLQVEEGTPFARWFSGDGSPLPKEPEAVAMFEAASATLTAAGYEHYEISNYAKPGHRSRHNQVYWKCQPYYAFGLGAASYTQGRRFSRPRGMHEYESWVQRFVQSGGGCPAAALPAESKEEQLLDLIMLSLRLSDGLALHSVQQEYGQDTVASLLPTIQGFLQEGLMQIVPELQQSGDDSAPEPGGCVSDADGYGDEAFGQLCPRLKQGKQCRVRLADPAGFLLSNDVISELFAQLDPSTLSQVL
ncbi:radical SAM enzyme [Scenedesmus sp. NREL 46B-D3]|nr:radical SAM enzyme [Scenedesmus sp. NREL 46B-D3]